MYTFILILGLQQPLAEGKGVFVYELVPPPHIAKLIDRIKTGKDVDDAVKTLGAIDHAAPYLRSDPGPVGEQRNYRRDMKAALELIETRMAIRHELRSKAWIEQARFDLLCDLLVDCRDDAVALKLAAATTARRERIADDWQQLGHSARSQFIPGYVPPKQAELERFSRELAQFSGDELVVATSPSSEGPAFVRANRCTTRQEVRWSWFVAARDFLGERTAMGNGLWDDSFLVINNETEFGRLNNCLVICDGDIKIRPGQINCIIVANGNITAEKGGGGDDWLLAATGNINLPLRKNLYSNHYHAGGKVTFDPALQRNAKQVREHQAALPFGIKFVDPKEFGLDLAMQNGGVQVMAITKESPFAKFGVEDADVITKIDEVTPKSLADFRRALRRGVIRESVILHIKRAGKDLTRIVFLDGIPVPLAPPPRPK